MELTIFCSPSSPPPSSWSPPSSSLNRVDTLWRSGPVVGPQKDLTHCGGFHHYFGGVDGVGLRLDNICVTPVHH